MARVIGPDAFERTMAEILGGIPKGVDGELPSAVSGASRLGRRRIRENLAAFSGWGMRTGRYAAGWAYRRKRTGDGWQGVVYNRDVPGLAHLLEKGHAKVGGGRVAGREHIAPAAEDAFDEFERLVSEAVGRAVGR